MFRKIPPPRKPLYLVRSEIVVSNNPHSKDGYAALHEIHGVLPGCRKICLLTVAPVCSSIRVRPLDGSTGEALISPEEWKKLVWASPVVPSRFRPVTLTSEIIAQARTQALSITNNPSVADRTHVYGPDQGLYNPMELAKAG